jgi:hypothetical protein
MKLVSKNRFVNETGLKNGNKKLVLEPVYETDLQALI